jgi:death-on-curing protein
VIYLTLAELVYIAERATGGQVIIRDAGLLETAAARPRATAFGTDAYPDLHAKSAALVHSLARNRALVDGNKRLALGAVVAFYGVNGRRLTLTNDAAYELIMQVAVGELDPVDEIAVILEKSVGPRP